MSLFLRLERPHAEPLLFCLRDLACTFGYDTSGIFNFRNVSEPHFALCSYNEQYYLQPHSHLTSYNEQTLSNTEEPFPLKSGDQISCSDYTVRFFVTDPRSEVASRTDNPMIVSEMEPVAWLDYSLAGSKRVFPVWADIKITLGDSPASMIKISDLEPQDLILEVSEQNGQEELILQSASTGFVQGYPLQEGSVIKLPNSHVLTIKRE